MLPAQETTSAAAGKAAAAALKCIRLGHHALRRADVAAVERFWAAEYVFINPRGESCHADARVANLREKRTAFDSLAHAPQEEMIRTYIDGNMAVYTTLLTIDGRYGGEAESESFLALGSVHPP